MVVGTGVTVGITLGVGVGTEVGFGVAVGTRVTVGIVVALVIGVLGSISDSRLLTRASMVPSRSITGVGTAVKVGGTSLTFPSEGAHAVPMMAKSRQKIIEFLTARLYYVG